MSMKDKPDSVAYAREIRVEGFRADALVLDPEEQEISHGQQVVWILEEPGSTCEVVFEDHSPFEAPVDGGTEGSGQQLGAPAPGLKPGPDGRIRATVNADARGGDYPYQVRMEDAGARVAPASGVLVIPRIAAVPVVEGPQGPVS